jgi:hypothetical protein
MTYRFFKDGKILSPPPGESSGSFSLNPRSVADSGSYVVVVENSLGSITSAPLILSFSVPTITVQPIPQITSVGQTVTLAVAANGYPAPAFVWKKNGVNVQSGASTTYTIPSVTAADAGSYTVHVVNSLGTVVSSVASVTVGPASFLSSLSVRSSLAANQTLILGAVIRGGNKSVLVRAAGPALNDFQLSGMEDPRLEFYTTSSAPLAANDDWPISLAPVSASVGAFPFINGSKDAALNQTLSGSFTVHGKGTGPGVILLEVYDVSGGLTGRLISLSARNRVGTGADSLIAGFAIAGTGTRNLLIRAAGPALAAFGVPGTLADPKIQIFDSAGKVVGENDDWAPALAGTFTNLGAFAFPPNSKDTALAVTLNAGTTYTVQVTGADGGVGEALVEIYEAP